MDRVPPSTSCRCGYASPTTLARCLGCGRRFTARCDRVTAPTVVAPRPVAARTAPTSAPARPAAARPTPAAEPSAFSGRDVERFAPPAPAAAPVLPNLTFGPVAVAGLVAAAWVGPDAPRAELLTAAALLGAGLAAFRPEAPAPSIEPAFVLPSRLTDDELRDALAAW
jgi:hypothetical protein